MAILDRPMFQRRLTKDELRGYGIPAFANGGVVQKFANGGGTRLDLYKKKIEPKTAITDLVEDRPTLPATGMIIPSSVYEQETTTETIQDGPDIELKEKPTPPKDLEQTGDGEMKMDDSRLAFERFKKKSDFYKDVLSKYGEDDMRTQGFLQLAQFGLNLMSQAGGNFLDKVAKSAQDPLKAFADIAARNTQAQKELDVLALKQVEDEIATEKQNEFDLALQAIKNSGGTDKVKVEKYADILQENFPEQYPNTKEGRAKAVEQGFKYVEESPDEPITKTVNDFKKIILADPGQYGAIDQESLEIDYDKVDEIAKRLASGEQTTNVANQGGEEVITGTEDIISELNKSAGT